MITSSSCFSESVYKTCHRQPTELKLGRLIVYSKLHKIRKFENHVTTNDVIMTVMFTRNNGKQWGNADLRKTKQIIYHSKGIGESYPKIYFLLNLKKPLCQKLWAFLSNLGIFYDARSPNMVMSHDPGSKFRKIFMFS